jgi:ABC-type Fe3+ transport system permease subunit
VVGYRLVDTIKTAALEAIHIFSAISIPWMLPGIPSAFSLQ